MGRDSGDSTQAINKEVDLREKTNSQRDLLEKQHTSEADTQFTEEKPGWEPTLCPLSPWASVSWALTALHSSLSL